MNKTESRDITKRIIIEFEREDKTWKVFIKIPLYFNSFTSCLK